MTTCSASSDTPTPWRLSYRADPLGRVIADRHYNRQAIGAPQFVPPGACVVLLADEALWVTSWPKFAQHAWAGSWVNSTFRRDGGPWRASDMILAAVAHTRFVLGEPPPGGMVTFVDESEVRHKRDPGRCYRRAGFEVAGRTKSGLLALTLSPAAMPEAEPIGQLLLWAS